MKCQPPQSHGKNDNVKFYERKVQYLSFFPHTFFFFFFKVIWEMLLLYLARPRSSASHQGRVNAAFMRGVENFGSRILSPA